jgi:tetratricopeptide (TPR) repeat protein
MMYPRTLLSAVCAFFLFSFFILTGYAQQNKADSLVRLISKGKSDTTTVTLMIRAAKEYEVLGSFDSSILYSEKAIELADLLLNKDPDSLLKRHILKQKASAYNYRGIAFRDIGNFPEALKNLLVSLKINETIRDKFGIGSSYNNIGLVYMSQGNNEKALSNYFSALKLYKEIRYAKGIGSVYNNMGIIYNSTGRLQQALENHLAAFKIRDSIGDKRVIAYSYNNIGIVYDDMGKYEDAVKNHLAALKIREELGDKTGVAGSSSNIGRALMRVKKFGEAEKYYQKARELAEKIGHKEYLKHIYGGLSVLDSMRGNYSGAYSYLKMHYRVRDSLDNEASRRKTLYAQVSYDFEKKEALQKAQHEKEKLLLESENKLQKNTRNFVIIISVLVLLLLSSGFIYYNIRKNLRVKQAHSRQLMVTQEKERQRISKELHDSVGQNILFIKNQMVKLNQLTLMPSVDETLNEIRSISKDLYPNQLERYGLVAAVEALAEKVHSSSGIFASHDLSAIEKDMDPEEQIQYYRIIQECVSNSVKHSAATALRIVAEKKNNSTFLSVQDNGKGFDKTNLSGKAQRSFGILNLEERARSLNGRMDIESSPGKGTKITFTIPG